MGSRLLQASIVVLLAVPVTLLAQGIGFFLGASLLGPVAIIFVWPFWLWKASREWGLRGAVVGLLLAAALVAVAIAFGAAVFWISYLAATSFLIATISEYWLNIDDLRTRLAVSVLAALPVIGALLFALFYAFRQDQLDMKAEAEDRLARAWEEEQRRE